MIDPYWALVSAVQAKYRRRSEGFRLKAPRSFRAGLCVRGIARIWREEGELRHTDDVLEVFPVVRVQIPRRSWPGVGGRASVRLKARGGVIFNNSAITIHNTDCGSR